MNDDDLREIHQPYVDALGVAGDWAGLVRYWMVHPGFTLALERAVALVTTRATRDSAWSPVKDYLLAVLANPLDFETQPPELTTAHLEARDMMSLDLVHLWKGAALSELATQFPADQQDQLLALAIQTAGMGAELSRALDDMALSGFFKSVMARGHQEVRDLESARQSYEEALGSYRVLAESRPAVYLPLVATTLNNLGTVQRDLNDLESARQSFEEALRHFEDHARSRPTTYLVERMRGWNNLGRLLLQTSDELGWPDRPAARGVRQGDRIRRIVPRHVPGRPPAQTAAHRASRALCATDRHLCRSLANRTRSDRAGGGGQDRREKPGSRADRVAGPVRAPAGERARGSHRRIPRPA